MRFSQALTALFAGVAVRREGWRNKFHLELDTTSFSVPVILRVADDSSGFRAPWAVVTEDDLFGDDWNWDNRGSYEPEPGTFAAALDFVSEVDHRVMRLPSWPEGMHVKVISTTEFPDVLVLRLTTGDHRIFRPAPQDLANTWQVIDLRGQGLGRESTG